MKGSLLARVSRHPIAVVTVVLLAASAIALGIGMPVARVTQIAIYTLYAAGVNFLIGYLGLVPFGASFFFGTAGYAVALIGARLVGGNELAGVLLAAGFSMLLALTVGAVILRRRGLYFSLLTLACSQIAFEIAFKWTDITGGENGIQNVARPLFTSALEFHWFALVVVLGVLWLLWRIGHSPFGRVMQALRDNEERVASLGYNTYQTKLVALIVASGAIGIAGGLMVLLLQGAYANNLSWQHAGDPVLMAALGGVHHFLGPLWGSIIFIALEDRLSALTENWWLFFAPIIIAFALLSHEGVQGIFQRLVRRERWTLTRDGIPPRPARIVPYSPPAGTGPGEEAPILQVRNLSKRFGSIITQNDISLEMSRTGLHSLIGPNGAGKTTFFNLLTGRYKPDSGEILFEGKSINSLSAYKRARLGIARSFQILSVFPNLTAFENVRVAVQASSKIYFNLWSDAHAAESINARVWGLLEAVGLTERAAEPCASMSHGEKRLLEIAVSLAIDAKLLLLDEPLAGLAESDRRVVGDLIRRLAQSHAVLLIEHDIDRVLAMSDRITVLHQGRLIADGKPAEVARHPEVVAAYLGDAHPVQDGGQVVVLPTRKSVAVSADRATLLELKGMSAGYGGSTVLEKVDLAVHKGEVVALLGRNGVGKTTLLRAVTGVLHPSEGQISFEGRDISKLRPSDINRLGISLVPEGRRLFPNLTVQENLRLAARPGGASMEEIFDLFPKVGARIRSRGENLSGGEQQMVAIARALMVPSKLILLDEPFEGLAPAVVQEVRDAVGRLSTRASMVIVEHHAESVLAMADRAYALVNGRVAYGGAAGTLAADKALCERLLGVVQADEVGQRAPATM